MGNKPKMPKRHYGINYGDNVGFWPDKLDYFELQRQINQANVNASEAKEGTEYIYSGDSSSNLDSLVEIRKFLEGYKDGDKLKKLVQQLSERVTTISNTSTNNQYPTAQAVWKLCDQLKAIPVNEWTDESRLDDMHMPSAKLVWDTVNLWSASELQAIIELREQVGVDNGEYIPQSTEIADVEGCKTDIKCVVDDLLNLVKNIKYIRSQYAIIPQSAFTEDNTADDKEVPSAKLVYETLCNNIGMDGYEEQFKYIGVEDSSNTVRDDIETLAISAATLSERCDEEDEEINDLYNRKQENSAMTQMLTEESLPEEYPSAEAVFRHLKPLEKINALYPIDKVTLAAANGGEEYTLVKFLEYDGETHKYLVNGWDGDYDQEWKTTLNDIKNAVGESNKIVYYPYREGEYTKAWVYNGLSAEGEEEEEIAFLKDGQLYVLRTGVKGPYLINELSDLKVNDLSVQSLGGAATYPTTKAVKDAIDEKGGDIQALTERVDVLEGELDEVSGKVDTAIEDIDALEARMDTAEEGLTSLSGRMDTAEGDIAVLEGRMDTAEDGLTALSGRMAAAESKIETAEADIDALEARMTTAENDIDTLEDVKEDVANKVTALSSASTDIQYPSAKAVFDRLNPIEKILDLKTNGYVTFVEAADGRIYLQEFGTAEYKDYTGIFGEIRSAISEAIGVTNKIVYYPLNENEYVRVWIENDEIYYEYKDGKCCLRTNVGRIETNESINNKIGVISSSTAVSTDYPTVKAVKDFVASTSGDIVDYVDEKVADLQGQIDEIDARVSDNTEEIEALQDETVSLKGRMTTAEADIDSLEGDMAEAKDNISELQSGLTEAQADIDSLEARMDGAEGDIVELAQRVLSAETDIDNLELAKQDKEDDALETSEKNVVGAINEVFALAQGRAKGISYSDYSTAFGALNNMAKSALKVGDNVFIIKSDVSDMWVSQVMDNKAQYTYVNDEKVEEDLLAGTLQAGYFIFRKLESKVDLTDVFKNGSQVIVSNTGNVVTNVSSPDANGDVTITKGIAAEEIKNKVTAVTSESTDVEYPTAKLLYTTTTALSGAIAANTSNIAGLTTSATTAASNIQGLRSDVNELSGKVGTLSANTIHDIEILSGKIDDNAENISTNTDAIEALTDWKNATNITLQSHADLISGNSLNIGVLSGFITSDRAKIEGLQSKVAEIDGQVSANTTDIAANTSDIAALSGRVNTFSSNTSSSLQALSAATANNATAISSVSGTVSGNTANIAKNADDITKLSSAATSAATDIASLKTATAKNASDIAALSGRVNTFSSSTSSSLQALSAATANNATAISSVSGTVSGNTANIAALSGQVLALSGTVSSNTSDITALKTTVNSHTTSLNTLNGKVDSNSVAIGNLTTGVTKLNEDVADLTTGVTKLNEDVANLQGDVDELKGEVSGYSQDIADIKAATATMSGRVTALDTKVDGYSTAIENLETRMDSAEDDIDELQGKISGYSQDIANLKAATATTSGKVDALDAKVDGYSTDITQLKANTGKNAVDIATISGAVTANTAAINTISGAVAQNTNDISTISGTVTAHTTQITQNTSNIAALSGVVTSHTNTINNLSGAVTANTAAINELNTAMTAANGSISEISGKVGTVSGAVTANTAAINTISGAVAQNTSNISSISAAVATHNTQISQNTNDIAAISGVVTGHTSSIAENTNDINTLQANQLSISGNVSSNTTRIEKLEESAGAKYTAGSGITISEANVISISDETFSEIEKAKYIDTDLMNWDAEGFDRAAVIDEIASALADGKACFVKYNGAYTEITTGSNGKYTFQSQDVIYNIVDASSAMEEQEIGTLSNVYTKDEALAQFVGDVEAANTSVTVSTTTSATGERTASVSINEEWLSANTSHPLKVNGAALTSTANYHNLKSGSALTVSTPNNGQDIVFDVNIDTAITSSATHNAVPSSKAVYDVIDEVEQVTATALCDLDSTKEDVENKVDTINSGSTNVQYPSAQAVWNLAVHSDVTQAGGGTVINNIVSISKAAYEALTVKDPHTIYMIEDVHIYDE